MSAKTQTSLTNIPVILLVDDDRGVRMVCRIVLERNGFQVHEANSAAAARAIWEIHSQRINLLVTDFDMPGLTGLELSQLFRTQRPELPVLLISGRQRDEIAIPQSISFLQKPFSPHALVEKVRECLAVAKRSH